MADVQIMPGQAFYTGGLVVRTFDADLFEGTGTFDVTPDVLDVPGIRVSTEATLVTGTVIGDAKSGNPTFDSDTFESGTFDRIGLLVEPPPPLVSVLENG